MATGPAAHDASSFSDDPSGPIGRSDMASVSVAIHSILAFVMQGVRLAVVGIAMSPARH